MENKFKQVTLRIFKYLPFDKQYVSHATEEMIEYKDKDTNYDYVDFIEIAAVEQLKAENNLLKENLNFWQCNPCEVIQEANKVLNAENEQLKSKIEYANDEIHTLKNKLLMFEGMTFSENQEITALKSKLEVAKKGLEFYADDFNWLYNEIKKSDCEEIKFNHVLNKPVPKGLEFEAGGKTARQALKEISEG